MLKKAIYIGLICFISAVLTTGVFSVVNLGRSLENTQRISNFFFSTHSVEFLANRSENCATITDNFQHDGVAVFQKLSENLHSVVCDNNYKHPPIKFGRYFSESDFKNHERYAVVGQKQYDNADTDEDGDKIIACGTDTNPIIYKIIGVIGTDTETALDNCIFITFSNGYSPKEADDFSNFEVDGNTKWQVDDFLENQQYFNNITNQKVISRGAARIVGFSIFDQILIFAVLIFFVLSYITSIIFWCRKNKLQFFVRRMFGEAISRIIINFSLRLFLINFIGMLAGILTALIIQGLSIEIMECVIFVIIATLYLLTLSFVCVWIYYVKEARKPISENIRRT